MSNNLANFIEQLSGEWHGTTRTWFEAGKLADESPNHATFRAVLNGRFLLHEYNGTLLGKAFEGMALYGFDSQQNKYIASWVDSAHMGDSIMHSQGDTLEAGFWLLGHYPDPQGGPAWGWRTEILIESEQKVTISAYNITPGGEEALAVETRYTRVENRVG